VVEQSCVLAVAGTAVHCARSTAPTGVVITLSTAAARAVQHSRPTSPHFVHAMLHVSPPWLSPFRYSPCSELVACQPPDWRSGGPPNWLPGLANWTTNGTELKAFALDVYDRWRVLCRQVHWGLGQHQSSFLHVQAVGRSRALLSMLGLALLSCMASVRQRGPPAATEAHA
jgi:hypothetical protein